MSLWTHQPGFPLLTVTKMGNRITISQKPFKPAEFLAIHDDTYDGNNYNKTTANSTNGTTTSTTPTPTTASGKHKPPQQMKWIFPITYVTDINNNTETLWMQNVDGKCEVEKRRSFKNSSPRKILKPIFGRKNHAPNFCVFHISPAVNFNVPESVKWIKVNARQSGYYRVLYNEDNWANIIEDMSNDPEKFTGEVSQ